MARRKLGDLLPEDATSETTTPAPAATSTTTGAPPFARELAAAPRHPTEPPTSPARTAPAPTRQRAVSIPSGAVDGSGVDPDGYKLTARLTEDEASDLETLTAAVVAEIAPRRIGKGWRTKVVRALVTIAARDPKLQRRIVTEVRRLSQP